MPLGAVKVVGISNPCAAIAPRGNPWHPPRTPQGPAGGGSLGTPITPTRTEAIRYLNSSYLFFKAPEKRAEAFQFGRNIDLPPRKDVNRGGRPNSEHKAGSSGPGAVGRHQRQLQQLPSTPGRAWVLRAAVGGEGWGSAPLPPRQRGCQSQLTRGAVYSQPEFFPIKKCKLRIFCINWFNRQPFLWEETQNLEKTSLLFN